MFLEFPRLDLFSHGNQQRIMKGRSTVTEFSKFWSFFHSNVRSGKDIFVKFLDLSKPFECVSHEILFTELGYYSSNDSFGSTGVTQGFIVASFFDIFSRDPPGCPLILNFSSIQMTEMYAATLWCCYKMTSVYIKGVMRKKGNFLCPKQNLRISPSPLKLKMYQYAISLLKMPPHMRRSKVLELKMCLQKTNTTFEIRNGNLRYPSDVVCRNVSSTRKCRIHLSYIRPYC